MNKKLRAVITRLLLTSASLGAAAEVSAQTQSEPQSASLIEEVLVTARKRAESLQEVPKSISVISAIDITERGASDFFTLTEALPNVSIETWGLGANAGSIGMRGIVSPELNAGVESAVGSYVDGVLQEGFSGADFDAADVERVEVLRGPQGTLFGRNSSAGALNVTTRDPADTLEGQIKLRGGNLKAFAADAFLAGPLVEDSLLFKLSGYASRRDGYYHNVFNGRDEQDDDRRSARGTLLWKASDAARVIVRADYAKGETASMSGVNAFQSTVPGFSSVGVFNATHDDHNSVDQENSGISLTAEFNLGSGHEVTSITSYRESEVTSFNDLDGTAVPSGVTLTPIASGPFTGFPDRVSPQVNAGPGPLHAGVTSLNGRAIDYWSQELRLTSPDGPFEYVLGLYYLGRELKFRNVASVDPDLITPYAATTPTGMVGIRLAAAIENESVAGFGHANWHLTQRWTLGFGARYTREQADFSMLEDTYLPVLNSFGTPVSTAQDRSEGAVSGDVSLTFHATDDVSVYGSAARGFKAGGFNTSAGTATRGAADFDNETVDTFELGLKSQFSRLRFNAAVFLSKFDDIQIQTFDPVLVAFTIRNAASATIQGFEVEALIQPMDGFSFSSAVGYTDAEFDEFNNCTRAGLSCAGESLLNAPEWTLSAAAQYEHSLRAGSVATRLDWSYRSGFYRAFNLGPQRDFLDRVEARDLLNARIAYRNASEKIEFALWGRNILDEEYVTQKMVIFDPLVLHGLPRTYGAEMTFRF